MRFAQQAHRDNHVRVVHLKIKQYRCKLCDTYYANTGNLEEHIGTKHLGFRNSKEWRRNKAANKTAAKSHEAYEYVKHWQDADWQLKDAANQ